MRILLTFLLAFSLPLSSSLAAVLAIDPANRLKANSQGLIEVCWFGNPHSETESLRQAIQEYLVSELQQKVGLKLLFINDCLAHTDPFYPVSLAFYDAQDNTPGIQNTLLGVINDAQYPGQPKTHSAGNWNNTNLVDIILTSHFQNVDPDLSKQAAQLSAQGQLNLLRSIALHEFLHALGFDHEQNRPDSQCSVGQEYIPSIDKPVTAYDAHSIMNYCNTHFFDYEKGPIPLSDLDIFALKSIYQNTSQ